MGFGLKDALPLEVAGPWHQQVGPSLGEEERENQGAEAGECCAQGSGAADTHGLALPTWLVLGLEGQVSALSPQGAQMEGEEPWPPAGRMEPGWEPRLGPDLVRASRCRALRAGETGRTGTMTRSRQRPWRAQNSIVYMSPSSTDILCLLTLGQPGARGSLPTRQACPVQPVQGFARPLPCSVA